jgi:hypothetical protein
MHSPIQCTLASALGLAIAVAIAGCGKSDNKPAPAVPAAKAPAAGGGTEQGASAQEVARQARGELSCPARITLPTRAQSAPVDDVLGVRPGLTYEEAMNAVLCTHELLVAMHETGRGFNIKAAQANSLRQGFSARTAEPRVVRSSKQIMQELQRDALARGGNAVREDLRPGQSKWFVATMGLPGQERVLSVAREERFETEQSPTVDKVAAALVKKYGTPTRDQRATSSQLPLLRWAYDPLGRLVTETSPLFNKCTGTTDPNGGVNLTPDCGIVVQAMLIPRKDNPALVERMQVGVVDQSAGYRMITETELALGQMDQQRRAKEVEKAAKNSKLPSL